MALLVEDLDGAEVFYSRVLGLPVQKRWPADDGTTRSVWLDLDGGAILMLERAVGDRRGDVGAAGWHVLALAIDASDRERWVAHLEEAGHAVVDKTDFTVYVEDPEKNRVALSHWPTALTPRIP